MAKLTITRTFNYKGRFACELSNGRFFLSNGSMELILCEEVPEGMRVIEAGIIGGIMMRTEEDFKWCVENTEYVKAGGQL